jgi:multidrug efflux pump subunit AcrB
VTLPAGKAMVMQAPVKGIRRTGESDLEIKIRGTDPRQLFEVAGRASRALSTAPHLRNVHLSLDLTKPEYQVRVDRLRASALGISVSDAASALQSLVRGQVGSRYREGDEYYPIRVMVPERALTSRAVLEELPLSCSAEGCTRFRDVARVEESIGPVEIAREDQVKQVVIRADAAGTSVGGALAEARERLASLELPSGYELRFGGQALMMAEARSSLLIVLAFALLFSFVILVVQFNQLRIPLIILSTVPFSLSGLVLLLAVTNIPVGATVVIGVLVVVAAHVTEGVLLLTYAEEIRARECAGAAEAVATAARTRFRPRLMTALGVLVGLLPIALNLEEGGDMLQPMAAGAVGGILTGVLVALYLTPALYVLTARRAPTRVAEGEVPSRCLAP